MEKVELILYFFDCSLLCYKVCIKVTLSWHMKMAPLLKKLKKTAKINPDMLESIDKGKTVRLTNKGYISCFFGFIVNCLRCCCHFVLVSQLKFTSDSCFDRFSFLLL